MILKTFSVIVSLSSGVFEIAEATGVQQGTKIVLHLKDDCKEFSSEDRVKGTAAGAASVKHVGAPLHMIYKLFSFRGCHKVQQLCQLPHLPERTEAQHSAGETICAV